MESESEMTEQEEFAERAEFERRAAREAIAAAPKEAPDFYEALANYASKGSDYLGGAVRTGLLGTGDEMKKGLLMEGDFPTGPELLSRRIQGDVVIPASGSYKTQRNLPRLEFVDELSQTPVSLKEIAGNLMGEVVRPENLVGGMAARKGAGLFAKGLSKAINPVSSLIGAGAGAVEDFTLRLLEQAGEAVNRKGALKTLKDIGASGVLPGTRRKRIEDAMREMKGRTGEIEAKASEAYKTGRDQFGRILPRKDYVTGEEISRATRGIPRAHGQIGRILPEQVQEFESNVKTFFRPGEKLTPEVLANRQRAYLDQLQTDAYRTGTGYGKPILKATKEAGSTIKDIRNAMIEGSGNLSDAQKAQYLKDMGQLSDLSATYTVAKKAAEADPLKGGRGDLYSMVRAMGGDPTWLLANVASRGAGTAGNILSHYATKVGTPLGSPAAQMLYRQALEQNSTPVTQEGQ